MVHQKHKGLGIPKWPWGGQEGGEEGGERGQTEKMRKRGLFGKAGVP